MILRIALRLLLNGVAVYTAAYVVSGVHIAGFKEAVIAGLVLGILNALLRPLLLLITLPINLLTLGLFTLIINGAVLAVADKLTDGLTIDTFGSAILAAVVISLVNWILGSVEGEDT